MRGLSMAKKRYDTGGDLLAAAWQEARAIERETGGVIRITAYPTSRQGVFTLKAQLCDQADGRLAGIRCQVELDYPSAQNTTFGGFWYRLLLHLRREIDTIAPNGMHV